MAGPEEQHGQEVDKIKAELERVKRRHEDEIDTLLKVSLIVWTRNHLELFLTPFSLPACF